MVDCPAMTTRPAKHLLALPPSCALALALALAGCRAEAPAPAPAPAASEAEAGSETGAAAPKIAAEAPAPRIAAEAPVFEFGAIKPTDTVEHVFKVKNEGSADLKIERVQRT